MSIPVELDRRFRDAAARSGMLDAGYDVVDSPIGQLLVATSDRGILRISFDPDIEQQLEWLSRLAGRSVLRAPRQVDPVRRELRRVLRGPPPRLRPRGRPARRDAVHRAGADGARPHPVRRDGDVRRARRPGRQPEEPLAPSA